MATITITIGTSIIEFPDSGSDPNWAPAVIDFAESVAAQLQAVASPFDVPPKVQILTSDANSNLVLEDCTFPSGSVRSFSLYYAIYRTNDVTALIAQGEIAGIYDTLNSAWVLSDVFKGQRQSDGIPYQAFAMSGDTVVLSTVAMGGSYSSTESMISFSAKTQLASQ